MYAPKRTLETYLGKKRPQRKERLRTQTLGGEKGPEGTPEKTEKEDKKNEKNLRRKEYMQ